MENINPFQALIELVTFDQKIVSSNTEIKKLEKEITILNNEIQSHQINLETAKNSWTAAKKEVDEKELKMKELDNLESDKKKKLEETQDTKEYSSLKKEIEKIKQIQYELEPKLLENWKRHELTKKDYDEKKAIFETKINDIQKLIDEKKEQINSLTEKLKNLNVERKEKEKNVPQEWIEKYNVMHLRVNNPVVPVVADSCSACFYPLTSQDKIDLKNKKLLQCKRCYRFLYLKE